MKAMVQNMETNCRRIKCSFDNVEIILTARPQRDMFEVTADFHDRLWEDSRRRDYCTSPEPMFRSSDFSTTGLQRRLVKAVNKSPKKARVDDCVEKACSRDLTVCLTSLQSSKVLTAGAPRVHWSWTSVKMGSGEAEEERLPREWGA